MPELAEQISTLHKPQRAESERKLMAGFPVHTDNSLLTLAPRASCSGLAVRDYASGKWVHVERSMADDEAILFCGDPLSFVSRHHFPACMHRPDAMEMVRQAPKARLSFPFFLYPDADATLDSTRTRAALRAADGSSALPEPEPATLSVADLKLNVGDCRGSWPWKRERYYDGLVLADDANPFPGELTQYEKRDGYS